MDDPADYVFCGHRELVKRIRDPLVDVDNALISFGTTLKEARRNYKGRIRAGMDESPSEDWAGIFGLSGPRDRDLSAPEPIYIDELGRSTGLERPALDAVRFLAAACSVLDVKTERLASSRRDRETAGLRKLITAVGVERWGQRAGQLAALLNKHPVAVSRWVSDAARRRQEDRTFEKEMDNIDQALSAWALDALRSGELAPNLDENVE